MLTRMVTRPGVQSSFRSICSANIDGPIAASTRHPDAPGIAADLAILDVTAADIELDVDLDLLAAIGARHQVGLVCFHRSTFRVVFRA